MKLRNRLRFATTLAGLAALLVLVPSLLNAAVGALAIIVSTAVIGCATLALSWAAFEAEQRFLGRP